jgi:signal transduction histidine kinase
MKSRFTKYFFALTLFFPAVITCAQGPLAEKGIIDLRNQAFCEKPISLAGEWLFFWGRLSTPGDTAKANSCFVHYPSLWKQDTVSGKLLPSQGYASYKLTIVLPKNRPSLALEMRDVYCSYALYINDKLVAQNGKPGKTAAQSKPFWDTRVVDIPEGTDSVSLILQVANFWHAKGGVYKDILIGNRDEIVLKYNKEIAYGFVLAGCLFMGGLLFLGLYFFGRQDSAILFFALFCISYSYRMIGADPYVLHVLFPGLDWFITIRLEYLSISLSIAFFALYSNRLYKEDCNASIIKTMVAICLLYAIIIIATPTLVFTRLMSGFLGIMFLYGAYALYVYVRATLHKRIGSVYALISSVVLLFIFIWSDLNYFHIAPPLKALVFASYIIFFFLQSLALSQRFAHSFKLAALQAQQGLNAKTEFLSTMSHEIRTPLNSVIGMAHLLKKNKPRPDQQENLNVLYFSANNLLSIVNNILDYNKIEEGKIYFENIPMDLSFIAGNIIAGLRSVAEEKSIELKLLVDPRLNKKLMGDPTRTSQVINNLVHNAIKFTEKGSVLLSISADVFSQSSVSVTIKVEDSGIGISQDKQLIIFERFTQADSSTSRTYGGTGLGLAITKRILELQGVQLRLESEPGKGSVFYYTQTFVISAEDLIVHNADKEFEKDSAMLQGVSILLVEDNLMNVLVVQTILEGQGATIDVAANGQEALDKFDTHKHKLILMDLNMPVLDGYKAAEQFRRNGETVPIIALTASAPDEVGSDAYASGLNDIVVKPFNPEDLYRVLLYHINKAV